MKRIALIVALVLLAVALAGCADKAKSPAEIAEQESNANKMFIIVAELPNVCGEIVYDKQTRVMYWVSNGSYNYGTLTMLVNADGTPRLWED